MSAEWTIEQRTLRFALCIAVVVAAAMGFAILAIANSDSRPTTTTTHIDLVEHHRTLERIEAQLQRIEDHLAKEAP